MSAWVLPDHIADALPREAGHIENLRRKLLDTTRGYGYELVIPPMMEHLDSLLTGTGEALDLLTFKLVDQLSGRTLGVRADTTPQVARIDAHLLNRVGVARLCYCGPVLHTRPDSPYATREPLQFGAELYGHQGLEADWEVQSLALDCLSQLGVSGIQVDMADARIIRALLPASASATVVAGVEKALATKDAAQLQLASADFPPTARAALAALPGLYGDARVLDRAQAELAAFPVALAALAELRELALQLSPVPVSFDLADSRGFAYYSGIDFAIYAAGAHDALVRGGRYDEVGAVFGRKRAAVGFSLDIKQLANAVPLTPPRAGIRAPWGTDADLRRAIAQLRAQGETVVCSLPGHPDALADACHCDRQLTHTAGRWLVHPL